MLKPPRKRWGSLARELLAEAFFKLNLAAPPLLGALFCTVALAATGSFEPFACIAQASRKAGGKLSMGTKRVLCT